MPVAALGGHEESVRCAAFSPDGAILATGGEDATIRLWSMPDGTTHCDPLRPYHDGAVVGV